MFDELLSHSPVLPLLAGYFFKFNIIMLNNRYKDVIDLIYSQPETLLKLAKHSYSQSLMGTLQIYLNLDLMKNPNDLP